MELFEEIRRGHAAGEPIKGLAKKLGVHRRMVRQAIASAIQPERKPVEKDQPRLLAPSTTRGSAWPLAPFRRHQGDGWGRVLAAMTRLPSWHI